MAQYRFNCQYKDNCTDCEYRREHGCSAPRFMTAETKFMANKALADELAKRFKFTDKAKEQILVGNYGIAKKLLTKVLYEPLQIKVVEENEETDS